MERHNLSERRTKGDDKEPRKVSGGQLLLLLLWCGWVEEGAWLDGFADESILIVVPGNYHFDDPNLY